MNNPGAIRDPADPNGVTVGDPSAPNGATSTLEGPAGTTSGNRVQANPQGPTTINGPNTANPANRARTPENVERDFAADIRSCEGLPPGEKTACQGEARRRRGNL